MNLPFDSEEEEIFSWWLDELKQAHLIGGWSRTVPSIKLTDGLYHEYDQVTQLKTKVKTEHKRQTLLNPSLYTADFKIWWEYGDTHSKLWDTIGFNRKITAPFIANAESPDEGDGYYSLVEVKGSWDNNNMTRLFVNNQKFIWDKYGIYVNLVQIPDFFKKTFTPQKYLLTKTGRPRKIKFPTRSLAEYLKSINVSHNGRD